VSIAYVIIPDRIDQVAAPPASPKVVSLNAAKSHTRITSANEDAQINASIDAATSRVQERTDRQLIQAAYRAVLPAFPCPAAKIELRPAPLAVLGPGPVLVKVAYRDVDGAEQVILDTDADCPFVVVKPVGPACEAGRIVLKDGHEWPETEVHPEAVKIDFQAGYGVVADAVPYRLVHAVKAGVAELLNYREKPDLDAAIDPFIQDFILWRE